MKIKSVTFWFWHVHQNGTKEETEKKINFRPKKFNHKNLSNLSTYTHTQREKETPKPCVCVRVSEEYIILLL